MSGGASRCDWSPAGEMPEWHAHGADESRDPTDRTPE